MLNHLISEQIYISEQVIKNPSFTVCNERPNPIEQLDSSKSEDGMLKNLSARIMYTTLRQVTIPMVIIFPQSQRT